MTKKDLEKLRTEEFIAYDLELIKNEEKWKKYARIVANELTELGSQFVHYTMNQVVKRIEND